MKQYLGYLAVLFHTTGAAPAPPANLDLTAMDMARLRQPRVDAPPSSDQSEYMLADKNMNAYIKILQHAAGKGFVILNTFFLDKLLNQGMQAVATFVDITTATTHILAPYHHCNHWMLVAVNVQQKCIRFYDSMQVRAPQAMFMHSKTWLVAIHTR